MTVSPGPFAIPAASLSSSSSSSSGVLALGVAAPVAASPMLAPNPFIASLTPRCSGC